MLGVADCEDQALNLAAVRGKNNRRRHDAEVGEAVAFVGAKFLVRRQNSSGADDGL